jgi:hypothetical protein
MRHFARFYTHPAPGGDDSEPLRNITSFKFQIPNYASSYDNCYRAKTEKTIIFCVDTMVAVHKLVPVLMSSIPSSLTTAPLWVDICGKLAPILSVAVFMAPIRKYFI